MDFDQINFHLENSSTFKLFKSENASLALGFFFHAFKQNYKTQIAESELKTLLEVYLQQESDVLRQVTPQGKSNAPASAEKLLNLWCDDKHRFLRKYYDFDSDVPLVELTYETERALEWVESLNKREFVGTHSRFFNIFQNLRTLTEQTQSNPQVRLKYLEQKKKEVIQEIKEIQTTGIYKKMDATQVRERFLNLIDDSRRLISDFGLVEDIFKDLAQKIKERKLIEFVSKGAILGEVLDAYDYLEESDQGKSFNAFWDFLMSSDMQQDLNEMIQHILNVEEIQSYLNELGNTSYTTQLRKLKANLLQVGKKVLQSKLRLSEELRKLLHQKSLQENKQVMSEINEIKKCFIENKTLFQNLWAKETAKDFIYIQFLPEVYLPMERPLWDSGQEVSFSNTKITYGGYDPVDKKAQLEELKNSFHVNKAELREHLALLLKDQDQVTLREVVEQFPIQKGLSEIVSYIEIALKSRGSHIHSETQETLRFCSTQGEGKMTLPQVIFSKEGTTLSEDLTALK